MQTKSPQELTQARLKALLDYDPETGVFTWKVDRRGRFARAGIVATSRNNYGYPTICVDGCRYLAHRLAFLWMTCAWPEHEVDHINGVRSDNRWENLREVTSAENHHNIGGPQSNNDSGFLGVIWYKRTGKWRAQIVLNGRRKFLGYHPTPELAYAAYLQAKDELHPTHMRLRNHVS